MARKQCVPIDLATFCEAARIISHHCCRNDMIALGKMRVISSRVAPRSLHNLFSDQRHLIFQKTRRGLNFIFAATKVR